MTVLNKDMIVCDKGLTALKRHLSLLESKQKQDHSAVQVKEVVLDIKRQVQKKTR